MRLAAPIDYTDSSTLRVGLGQTPIVVSFSGGKDCVAAWQALRESGANVVAAVYLYLVPGLSFVESHLDRCERQFGVAIERWPHPSLNRMLRNGVFQPPTHRRASDALPSWTMPRMDKWVQRRWPGSLLALGARVTDNLTRRVASKHHHAEYNRKRRTLWPIYDWTTEQTIEAVRRSGCRLSAEYRMFGRTFDGVHHQYLEPIREHYPDDYAKILRWFPMADMEFTRRAL